jgi:hypothetical protein
MRNAQISAPVSRTPAGIKKGGIQNPRCTRAPKMTGDRDAVKLPAIFITPQTVPLYAPPYVHRHGPCGANHPFQEDSDAVKHKIAVHAAGAVAAGIRQTPRMLFRFSLCAISFCLRDPSLRNQAAFKPFGTSGRERKRTPLASKIALARAGATPTRELSPAPADGISLRSMSTVSNTGTSLKRGSR